MTAHAHGRCGSKSLAIEEVYEVYQGALGMAQMFDHWSPPLSRAAMSTEQRRSCDVDLVGAYSRAQGRNASDGRGTMNRPAREERSTSLFACGSSSHPERSS
jgi:hypothetical protein